MSGRGGAGLGLGLSPGANRLAASPIYLLYPISQVVFLPLLGIGNLSKVFIIALILFFEVRWSCATRRRVPVPIWLPRSAR